MDIGEVQQLGNTFRWTIPEFFKVKKYRSSYISPYFETAGSNSWYLDLLRKTNGPYSERICLSLSRSDGPMGVLYFTLGIEDKNGKVYTSTDVTYESTINGRGAVTSVQLSTIVKDRKKISQKNSLTVICTLMWDRNIEIEAIDMTEEKTINEFAIVKVETVDADKFNGKDCCRSTKGLSRLSRNLKDLFISQENSDVTLKVKERTFRAHKAILRAQSSVLGSMFKDYFREKSIVDITDCDPDSFEAFLIYLYSGDVEKVTASNVLHLYQTAETYDVAELKMDCVQTMITEISEDNFCDFVSLALRCNEETLLEAATEFFTQKTKKVIVTPQWQSFLKEHPVAATELYIKVLDKNGLQ